MGSPALGRCALLCGCYYLSGPLWRLPVDETLLLLIEDSVILPLLPGLQKKLHVDCGGAAAEATSVEIKSSSALQFEVFRTGLAM